MAVIPRGRTGGGVFDRSGKPPEKFTDELDRRGNTAEREKKVCVCV